MATISQPPSLSQSAISRSSLVVASNSRISCVLPFFEAGDNELLVHINTTTIVVNFFYNSTSNG
ncbi:hypothetical protein [Enterocloster clostridioformis]|jgi:hypothetical protein|uniref:hypothetical protein n=1 Tax=Enterocloster clostridioformis TaxID=1531 RepID=UPI000A5ED18B|nr:hypothetical protein [Enterocloster clostridioformis]